MAKILLIEDDQTMSELYQTILTSGGYQVVAAENGKIGVEKAKSEKPNLVLMDIMMPIMNGFEALDEIKKDPQTTHIPVVMLTNMAGEREKEIAKQKGATDYIVKSDVDPGEMSQIIKNLLSKTSS